MKPIIGITDNYIKDDQAGIGMHIGGKNQHWHMLADDYVTAVQLAGGIPIILPTMAGSEEVDKILQTLDGIIFSGGSDISPLLYWEDAQAQIGQISLERDRYELSLLKRALEGNIGILGICRGCQMLNVACGGSLVHDIDVSQNGEHMFPSQPMENATHMVTTAKSSIIQKIIGSTAQVNSYHHQCVKETGKGVEITAMSKSGVPEAIEIPSRKAFTLGVQWHPEGLAAQQSEQLNIFKAFINSINVK